ncbi:uncharacterized protein LOC21407060 [Morus notabilis]|uniref:uncharacterized protein LOC21407060 n=1 Tax=Morus notabilis TaxID=981085 RepID=UPI000CED64EA|nr:uncharacterized protein LOC21407060 [Morus notabilis]
MSIKLVTSPRKMDGLALTVATAGTVFSSSFCTFRRIPICTFSFKTRRRVIKTRNFCRGSKRFAVFASKEEPKLDPLDQMELQFGRLLGEDPKLTLAKIMGRKANPDATFIDIEKSFYKNKGKMDEVKGVPIDWAKDGQSSSSLDGLNLIRPVPKKGFEFKSDDNDKPIVSKIKKPSRSVGKAAEGIKHSVPNVILRKPNMVNEPDVDDKPSRLRLRPNLSLKMRNRQAKEEFSDMTLLRKPEPMSVNESSDAKEERKDDVSDVTLLNKPKAIDIKTQIESSAEQVASVDYVESDLVSATVTNGSKRLSELTGSANVTPSNHEESVEISFTEKPTRLQPDEPSVVSSGEEKIEKGLPHTSSVFSSANLSVEAALVGKPKRLDQSVKGTSVSPVSAKKPIGSENVLVKSPVEGIEDADWTRAEGLLKTGDRGEVELISCSTRGFVVSFGSLIGFLPYRNLSSKWKFLAFESWLRRKGLDPSLYRQNLGIIGNYEAATNSSLLRSSIDPKIDIEVGGEISPDMKLEDLLKIYEQEKIKFLSSFVGQKLKVNVLLANRKSGKLLVSLKPKEKEELIEKKRSLMAKLQVGDVVKCCIKKITYFGIFVEVDGVPALIHQTEVSWDATLDPASYFKVGQIVEAKVHQLDFALDRIFLSLKEIMPDPLIEALESVVGDHDPLDGRLKVAEADTEWADVESLIKELEQIEGIESVSKGRFFMSPGLAPTFQVYMASMFENQYKLLARSGNKVQEVIVQTSLGKEELKSTILTCTNRVE